ncbi:Non-structural protein NS1 [Armadillidium vulgare]|nr:Non-structural protein NS1 [Armadillidium vulgare]
MSSQSPILQLMVIGMICQTFHRFIMSILESTNNPISTTHNVYGGHQRHYLPQNQIAQASSSSDQQWPRLANSHTSMSPNTFDNETPGASKTPRSDNETPGVSETPRSDNETPGVSETPRSDNETPGVSETPSPRTEEPMPSTSQEVRVGKPLEICDKKLEYEENYYTFVINDGITMPPQPGKTKTPTFIFSNHKDHRHIGFKCTGKNLSSRQNSILKFLKITDKRKVASSRIQVEKILIDEFTSWVTCLNMYEEEEIIYIGKVDATFKGMSKNISQSSNQETLKQGSCPFKEGKPKKIEKNPTNREIEFDYIFDILEEKNARKEWIKQFFNSNEIDIIEFLAWFIIIADKRCHKINTLVVYGNTNTGKSLVIRTLLEDENYGYVVRNNGKLMFDNLVLKNFALLEEPIIKENVINELKLFFEGAKFEANIKNNPSKTLGRIPTFVTTNHKLESSLGDVDGNALKTRIKEFTFKNPIKHATVDFPNSIEPLPDDIEQISKKHWAGIFKKNRKNIEEKVKDIMRG